MKRPYYLTDAMQFAIPFIKVAGTSSGNAPPIPERIVATDEEPLDDTQHADSAGESPTIVSNQRTADDHPPSLKPNTPNPRPPPSPPQTGIPTEITTEPASSPVAAGFGPKGRNRKRLRSQNDVDKELITYFRAKTAQITKHSSPNTNSARREGIQDFLNSLIPDLLPMTDAELRVFKIKTLLLVDEVLDARDLDHHGTAAMQRASYHVPSPHGSTGSSTHTEESSVQ